MRTDIQLHIKTGDVGFINKLSHNVYEFRWVDNPDGLDRYIYGEVEVPSNITERDVREYGVCFYVPYTPKYKEIKLRIRRKTSNGFEYVRSQKDNSEWYVVKSGLYGGDIKETYASQLILISRNELYAQIDGSSIVLYDGRDMDFNIVNANQQNTNCMLACVPTNNYKYPGSGIGLVRWINSTDINNEGLSDVLNNELEEDGVHVKNAYYNYETNRLELDLDYSNAQ